MMAGDTIVKTLRGIPCGMLIPMGNTILPSTTVIYLLSVGDGWVASLTIILYLFITLGRIGHNRTPHLDC